MEASSIQFAAAARVLGDAARSQGLTAPSFRSPPRLKADRTLLRRRTTVSTVAVRVRGRPWLAVLGDLIEGVVVSNGLAGPEADGCRTALWAAVEEHGLAKQEPTGAGGRVEPTEARTTVDPTPGWRKRHTQAA